MTGIYHAKLQQKLFQIADIKNLTFSQYNAELKKLGLEIIITYKPKEIVIE